MSSGSRGGSVTPTYVPGNRLAAAADPYLPTQNAPMLPHPAQNPNPVRAASMPDDRTWGDVGGRPSGAAGPVCCLGADSPAR